MNLFFWRKNKEEETAGYAPYEEIESKKTSKLGYFFLIVMVIAGISQGQGLLSAIQRTVDNPLPNSACTQMALTRISPDGYSAGTNYTRQYQQYSPGYYGSSMSEQCKATFSSREMRLGIDTVIGSLDEDFKKEYDLNQQVVSIEGQMRELSYNNQATLNQYSVGLLEKIAKEKAVLPTEAFKQTLSTNQDVLSQLSAGLEELNKEKLSLGDQITATLKKHVNQFEAAEDEYRHDVLIQELKRFLLAAILVFPLCAVILRLYFASRRKRSEYVIIWGGLSAIASILAAQVLAMFIYEILPREIFQRIWEFLRQFEFIFVALYWLGFILIPLFFGFLIYIIQKKFYNKKAVMMRALKSGKCPGCSNKISDTMTFCPVCGFVLKKACPVCHNLTTSGAAFCQACGQKNIVT